MKKILNYRPIFYSFVAFALGIFFSRYYFNANIFIIVASFCAFFALAVLLTYTKHLKRFFALIVSFAIGIGVFALSFYNFNNHSYSNGTYTVSGRISTVADYSSAQAVVLDNVYINGEKIDKNVKVFVQNSDFLELGYVITFTDYLECTKLFTLGSFNNYEYKYNIAYNASTSEANVTVDKFDGLTVSESLRSSVKLALQSNLSPQEASVCYASLFGDKSLLQDDIKDNFSISGIAHLLAVSGLHVGFVAVLIMFFLKKIPYNYYFRVPVLTALLLFYCYLCSFSASVVRATIMAIVMCVSEIVFRQYDRLNSLSLAGIIILLFKPLSVFDPAFCLSFFCVFAITMFVPIISNKLEKLHMPNWLNQSLSVILSVQLGLLPLTIYYYGKVSLLSILTNLICVPVFEVFFIILFIVTPLVCLLPALGFLLYVPGQIIKGIMYIAEFVAKQQWAVVNLALIPVFVIVALYVAMFILSHFLNLKFVQKLSYAFVIILCACFVAVGMTLPTSKQLGVSVLNTYGESAYVLEFGGVKYCVGNFDTYSKKTTEKYLSNVVYSSAESMLFLGDISTYNSSVYNSAYNATIYESDTSLMFNKDYTFKNITVSAKSIDSSLCGYLFSYNNFKILVCADDAKFEHICSVIYDEQGVDLLICQSGSIENSNECLGSYTLTDGNNLVGNDNYNFKTDGNWTINFENNKASVRSLD